MADLVAACAAFIRSPHYWDATPRQIMLLGILCDDDRPHEVRSLAAQIAVSRPVITRATNSLIARGLVDRWRSNRDGRLVEITATKKGHMVREAMRYG